MSTLRLARVDHCGSETLALEHQGQLLSVPVLERRLGLESSPARFSERATSFEQRVFSLGLAGLEELVYCLGDRPGPQEARLEPAQCLYLPPTVTRPALLEFAVRAEDPIPRFRWGNGRVVRGHNTPLSIPADEPAAQLSVQIAAVLGEETRDVPVEQADRCIVGFSLLCLWSFPSREQRSRGWGRNRLGQLGPFLITPEEGFDPAKCSVSIWVNQQKVVYAPARPWTQNFAEMVSFASEGTDLLPGDLIASGPLATTSSNGQRALCEGDRITVEVPGLDTVSGVIVTGPSRAQLGL